MVTNEATLKRDGIQDWVTLRATAVIILAFSLFMGWFFLTHDNINYQQWSALFSNIGVKVFTLATLVSILLHVRIGLWQVLTDYVKAPRLRVSVQYILNLIAFAFVGVGIFVLLGV